LAHAATQQSRKDNPIGHFFPPFFSETFFHSQGLRGEKIAAHQTHTINLFFEKGAFSSLLRIA
jgi:hypothetical protein